MKTNQWLDNEAKLLKQMDNLLKFAHLQYLEADDDKKVLWKDRYCRIYAMRTANSVEVDPCQTELSKGAK